MALYYPSISEDKNSEPFDLQVERQSQIAPGSVQLEGILIKGPADSSPSSPRV